MTNHNAILESMGEARELSEKYRVPVFDIIAISLNCEGVRSGTDAPRVRFSMQPTEDMTSEGPFYFALTNNRDSRWVHDGRS
jgi:hypothetical protein